MDDGSLCALHANGPVHAMESADGAVGIRAAGFRTQCAIRGSTLRLAGLTGLLAALLALASIGILASLPRLLAGRLIAVLGVFLGLLLLRLLLLVGLILIGHYKSPDRRKKLRYQGNSNCRAQMPCRRAPGGNGWRPRFSTGKSWPLWKKLRKRRQACERYWVMTRAGKPGSVSLAPPSKASIQDDA